MQVREGMSEVVLTIGPGHTLREAAAAMCRRSVGAAIVARPGSARPGRDHRAGHPASSIGEGEDPDKELVADHLTAKLTFASPDWSLEQAAAAMVRGRLSPSGGGRRRRARRDPLDARHRALLDGGRRDLRGPGGRRGLGRQQRLSSLSRAARAQCWVLLGQRRDVAARVPDPAITADDEDHAADDREDPVDRRADHDQRDPERADERDQLGPGRWISSPTGGAGRARSSAHGWT